mgnify:CR=1 FL=1
MGPKDLVGKRVLFRRRLDFTGMIYEAKVVEVSPSGKYVKLEHSVKPFTGREEWVKLEDIEILEVIQVMGDMLEGKLFIVRDYEWWDAIITDKDLSKMLDKVGYDCKNMEDGIGCTSVDFTMIDKLGRGLKEILERYHGKKVRITIEVVE